MAKKFPDWLEDAVFYQIYPQSFFDANDDGMGDLPGIIQKLDYIKKLGCNAIWINPCFESPFLDAGYDIKDYYNIAPRYGTNSDMKTLFEKADKMGIKVCLDLVPGHTSVQCEWFKESAQDQSNKYTNWYIWTDSVWKLPKTEMTTVNGYAERNGNYLPNFFYHQPALNYGFANPDAEEKWQLPVDHPAAKEIIEEMKSVMRFWLEMGADGFRVDMASSLVKGDTDFKYTNAIWREIREMMDKEYPNAVLISEWGSPAHAIKAGFHIDFLLHFNGKAYTSLFRKELPFLTDIKDGPGHSFFSKEGKGDIMEFLEEYLDHYNKTKKSGLIAIPSGNHDMPRLSYKKTKRELEIAFIFLLTMPGVPFIYYGDEIGMRYQADFVSKEGGYERTGSRTPMQWTDDKNAGFSQADSAKLYLPVDDTNGAPSVSDQETDDKSLLSIIRNVIRLKQENLALKASADFKVLYAEPKKYPFIYLRSSGKNKILVALNPSRKSVTASFKLPGVDAFAELKMVEGIRLKENKGVFFLKMKEQAYGIFKF